MGLAVLGAVLFMLAADSPDRSPGEAAPAAPAGGSRGSTPPGKTDSAPPTRVRLAPGIVLRAPFGLGPEEALPECTGSTGIFLGVLSVRDLEWKLSALDYSLREVRRGSARVPRLQIASLPPDMAGIGSVAQRKRLFIMAVLPLVLQVNEEILADREKLLDLTARDGILTQEERKWIAALAERHGAGPVDPGELITRVDAVPPSLAIAQAAEESGWGRSRFAVEANAVFGQWTYRAGSGVVPRRRGAGERHEVRSFDGPRQSVAAYMRNLNSHWAYEEFRRRRDALRRSGEFLTGEVLVGTLQRYSERGPDYVETIRTIMRQNRLADFDRARLERHGDCP
ncbi:MAG: glucosaminidase domain-containing protein [Defluviicoccus sp.]|nr:glucosaminidase domain-containing protein [Defluviicoccus sp.]